MPDNKHNDSAVTKEVLSAEGVETTETIDAVQAAQDVIAQDAHILADSVITDNAVAPNTAQDVAEPSTAANTAKNGDEETFDYERTVIPGTAEKIKDWGRRFSAAASYGSIEAARFFRNPVRYVKAHKGKNYLIVKSENTDIVHNDENVLEIKGVKKYFPIKKGLLKRTVGYVRAVDDVSFNIKKGTTMGLVGESGCGKTTVGRTILRLIPQTGGEILFNGRSLIAMSKKELRQYRPNIQIVFQDPYSSLSPRMPIGEIIGEAVRQHGIVPPEQFDDYISKIMHDCGLQEYHKNRYPHEFSGGQRQRICIARALALDPKFIVCDEPVSALDVSIQAQIINLLKDLQEKYNLTYLFISHDLSVVEHISNTVGVMYLGSMVEYAPTEKVFAHPLHPYTEALFSAIPVPDPDYKMNRIILQGSIPSPANPPKGCKFHTRCGDCKEICKHVVPRTLEVEPDHFVACHKYCSVEEYNDPDYSFEESVTAPMLREECRRKLAELAATVPQSKAEREAQIKAEIDSKFDADMRRIDDAVNHRIDIIRQDRVIVKNETLQARARMYQKLNALPQNERSAAEARLKAELESEIEQIKERRDTVDAEIEKKAVKYREAGDKRIAEVKAASTAALNQKLKELNEELTPEKEEELNRQIAQAKAAVAEESKKIKAEYRIAIRQKEKESDDVYVKGYEEYKVASAKFKALQKQRVAEEKARFRAQKAEKKRGKSDENKQ